MSYIDLGYDKFLNKKSGQPLQNVITEDEVNTILPAISASIIRGGTLESNNGFFKLDLNTGKMVFSNTNKQTMTFSGEANEVVINDGLYDRIWIDGNTGTIKASKEGADVKTATTNDLVMSSDFSFVRESWLNVYSNYWNEDRWTNSGTYVDITNTTGQTINFDTWQSHNWYFEVLGFVDGGTGYWQLYNETTAEVVSGSEITTTEVSVTRVRSSAITKPSGENSFKIQHKISPGGGSDYINLIQARMVFSLD